MYHRILDSSVVPYWDTHFGQEKIDQLDLVDHEIFDELYGKAESRVGSPVDLNEVGSLVDPSSNRLGGIQQEGLMAMSC